VDESHAPAVGARHPAHPAKGDKMVIRRRTIRTEEAEDTTAARTGLVEWLDALRQATGSRYVTLSMRSEYDRRRGFRVLTVSLADQRRVA